MHKEVDELNSDELETEQTHNVRTRKSRGWKTSNNTQAPDHVNPKSITVHIKHIENAVAQVCAKRNRVTVSSTVDDAALYLPLHGRPFMATVSFNEHQLYCSVGSCACFERFSVPHFLYCTIGLDPDIPLEEFISSTPSAEMDVIKMQQWENMKVANNKTHYIWTSDHNKVSN
jgi:hypothetical protein